MGVRTKSVHPMSSGGDVAYKALGGGLFFGNKKAQVEYVPDYHKVNSGAADIRDIEKYRYNLRGNADAAQARQAAQLDPSSAYGGASIATGPQGEVRSQQGQLMRALAQRAAGGGPATVAQLQMQQGSDRAIAAARSLSASQPGVSPAQALNAAQQQAANIGQETNRQSAMLRAGETAQAQQALGQLASGMRGQDIGLATSQAGFDQQAGMAQNQFQMANLDAKMKQAGMNDAQQQAMINSLLGLEQSQMQGKVALEQAETQRRTAENQMALQAAMANAESNNKGGGLLGGGLF